ncbi:MAG: ATP-binding protein [Candidatus Onthomonas sp.]
MRKAILRSQMLAVLAALLACILAAVCLFDAALLREQSDSLQTMVRAEAALWNPETDPETQLRAIAGETLRGTLIAADGTVLADTRCDPAQMENHLDRPELQAAARGEENTVFRTSETLGQVMLYAAAQTPSGDYLRLARTGDSLGAALVWLLPALGIGAVLAFLLALLLARRLTWGILAPIQSLSRSLGDLREGKPAPETMDCPFPELNAMAEQIRRLTGELGDYLRQLEEEQRKTSYILNHLEEGFLLLDDRQKILMVNLSARRQLGCGPDCVGQSLGRVIPSPRVLQRAREIQDGRAGGSLDLTCRGRVYAVRFRRTEDEPGLANQLILTLNDITEERHSSRMRQEFFSNASHELKTPITAIKGNTELLCSGLPLSEQQRQELLGRIGSETERMSSVINDIIMLSRLESGALQEERERLNFGRIVSECAQEWEAAATAGQVTLSCQTEPVWLYASRKNLRELADNLISNAVKYNRPGGAVEICLAKGGENCCLTVRNDGEPIPTDQQRRVFERFYRVDKGRSRSAGGTGLGLSIVKHVVESLDGCIRLESSAELGTRFTVTLPIRPCP